MSRIDAIAEAASNKDPNGSVTETVTDVALNVAQTGAPGFGALGYVAGIPFSFLVANRDAQKALLELSHNPAIRSQVAAHMGVPEAAVNPQLLLMAAEQEPALYQAVQAIDAKKESHAWVNGAGIAGMAGSMATLAALSTGPVGWIAGGLAATAGAFLGEGIGQKVFGADGDLNPMTHIERIKTLRAEGVSEREIAAAVFALRVAQNPALQEGIEHQMGAAYFSLTPEQQQEVMMQAMGLSQASLADAQLLMQHTQLEPEYLLFGQMPQPQQQAFPIASPVAEFAEAGVEEFPAEPKKSPLPEGEGLSWAARVRPDGARTQSGSWRDAVTQPTPSDNGAVLQ